MSILNITDDERQPIVVGKVEILPFEPPPVSARGIARDAVRRFRKADEETNRQTILKAVARKIRTKFGC